MARDFPCSRARPCSVAPRGRGRGTAGSRNAALPPAHVLSGGHVGSLVALRASTLKRSHAVAQSGRCARVPQPGELPWPCGGSGARDGCPGTGACPGSGASAGSCSSLARVDPGCDEAGLGDFSEELGVVFCTELTVLCSVSLSQASRRLHAASEPGPFGLERCVPAEPPQ